MKPNFCFNVDIILKGQFMTSAVVFQIQSVIIYTLMIFGIIKRKNRKIHVPIMASVIIWDIILILQIELTRNAIAKASKAMINPLLLNIHVSFAVSSVVFYLLLIFTGRKLLKGEHTIKSKHRLFGWCAFLLRSLTLITSFFAVVQK